MTRLAANMRWNAWQRWGLVALFVLVISACNKKPLVTGEGIIPAEPDENISLFISNDLFRPILEKLCESNYDINFGNSKNYVIFEELKSFDTHPETGEMEISLKGKFSVSKAMLIYKDEFEVTLMLKPVIVKDNENILFEGWGRVSSIKTPLGKFVDKSLLEPKINASLKDKPLFSLKLNDMISASFAWPKLGTAARNTVLKLNDARIIVLRNGIDIKLKIESQTN